MGRLKVAVKQGEELNISFTIKQEGEPLDLSNYSVSFKVKRNPLLSSEPIIDKYITLVSDGNEVGIIDNPEQGKFYVHLKEEDTSFPVGEYSLIIALIAPYTNDIISSSCCNGAIFKICEQ